MCLLIDFIFQLFTRGIQNTGSTGNFKNLSQRQNLEIMKSSRSKEAIFRTVEEFYLMSKAVCRSRLRAQWECNDLQPVSICRQTGSKQIVYKCLLQCWLTFHQADCTSQKPITSTDLVLGLLSINLLDSSVTKLNIIRKIQKLVYGLVSFLCTLQTSLWY